MHILDILERDPVMMSIEFFPPKTDEAAQTLDETLEVLNQYNPSFIDLTYGAGGTTRDLTVDKVCQMHQAGHDVVPHLTTVCQKETDIRQILEAYAAEGVSNILALRGDPPRSMPDWDRNDDDFGYAADLVRFIHEFNGTDKHPDPRGFGIGVAGFPEGHPAEPQRVRELEHLKQKCEAGAHYICTQFFFDNRDFHDFRARCEHIGIKTPIVAGIMPITSRQMFEKLPEFALGARYPIELLEKIDACGDDDEAIFKVGVEWATEQCRDLLDNNVRGLHFYCLNKWEACKQVFDNLDITKVAGRRGDANPSLQTSK